MKNKTNIAAPESAAIIGSNTAAVQAALTLAQMGIEVRLVTNLSALGWSNTGSLSEGSSIDQRYFWPLLLRAATHPLITLYCNTDVERINGKKGDFKIQVRQRPSYVNKELCTACGKCQTECSVSVTSLSGNEKITQNAIHTPIIDAKSVPSAYVIDKNGFAPCRVACPLGINVQGFVSLLSKNKTDKALTLISETAPFSGILGRVCRHPCEDKCSRTEADSSVSIRALHRYAADNAPSGINYTRKAPAGSRMEKIAIVGSGPAGLTAAWELTRRGYSPTIFESHSVIGGMLATGIPRFRLPREVREKELEAIRNLGVDIRTGITVGRDVTFAYLKERGYRVFFLAIGAQQNNKLNIPGEELGGVVDCISLLLTLNLRVDTFVGQNVVVIGDGNSAIDSARAANRRSEEGRVKVLSWTVPEEITAGQDELKEAIQEKVDIEYCTVPVEILGSEGKVTGIRCQRTRLTDEIMPNGRHLPEPIPGTDFVIDADNVVVAIGQSPNAVQLGIECLEFDSRRGVVRVNPLTLETSVKGVFAGGDCVTGPNNVVQAMADGLRAAESIDRYIQEQDLEIGRSLEPQQLCEVDIKKLEIPPYKRAHVPVISYQKRLGSYEETTKGLSTEVALKETKRCLNCALCSQCMECTIACETGAVTHNDTTRQFGIKAGLILGFSPSEMEASKLDSIDSVRIILTDGKGLADQLTQAMAVALETAIELQPEKIQKEQKTDFVRPDKNLVTAYPVSSQLSSSRHLGVFLCRCGGSISSVIDFKAVNRRLLTLPGVSSVQEIAQACTEDGVKQLVKQVAGMQLTGVVLAACRCCNLEQVCYSCTDRRQICQQNLFKYLTVPENTLVEFCNIREHCAQLHKDDSKGATRKAVDIISSAISRTRITPSVVSRKETILPEALILGGGQVSLNVAVALASRGHKVDLMTRHIDDIKPLQKLSEKFTRFVGERLFIKPWPDFLSLSGSPGQYKAELTYDSQSDCVSAGALLVNMDEVDKGAPVFDSSSIGRLLGRLIRRERNSNLNHKGEEELLREITVGEIAGIFLLLGDYTRLPSQQKLSGLAIAARVSAYLEKGSISPRATAVNINPKACRGCGDCVSVCPYIEMRERDDGTLYACVDEAMCLGCGTCVAYCPTGAITQPRQSDEQIVSVLRSLLQTGQAVSKV